MNGRVDIDPEQVIARGNNIRSIYEDYLLQKQAVMKTTEEVETAWEGADSAGYVSAIHSYDDDFKKLGEVIAQLGNRVQHTLRAYTPAEQRTVKVAADAFRTNPKFNTQEAILALGTGEALVSFQNENGEPEIVEKATILPPQSKMGVIDDITRNKIINTSSIVGKYDETVERDSAYEELNSMIKEKIEQEEAEKQKELEEKEQEKQAKLAEKEKKEKEREEAKKKREAERAKKNDPVEKLKTKATNKVVNKVLDKAISKGLNSIFKSVFK